MESKTINMLEFPKVLQYLSDQAVSPSGKQACLEVSFFENSHELDFELSLLREIISSHEEYGLSLNFFPDITSYLNDLKYPDSVFDTEYFWDFSAFLREAEAFFTSIQKIDQHRYPILKALQSRVIWPEKFVGALKRCLGPTGEIRDESSPELYAVREEIRSIRQQCSKKVSDSLDSANISRYLQDEYLTISSDRYVLALKSNFKGRIQGIIHDYSQTGETCYFEPFFLTELNNKLQKLKQQERKELRAILRYLTGLCRQSASDIASTASWLARMDFILAKAGLAAKLGAEPLSISDNKGLKLKNVRHPLLVLGGFSAVPVDIELLPGQQALIISGGNAGGKTVCLKTLGLAALMARCALPVPADEGSVMPGWNNIFVSMVSQQSVEESLSTFTAQIDHFCRFWPRIDEKSLVILDEFGVGTDPGEGAALAQAVVDELLEKKAWVATATHFPALKSYALTRDYVRAASVLFDDKTGKPLYRIAYDQVGASLALGVAREKGLPGGILARAEKYMLVEGQGQSEVFEKLNRLAVQREKELDSLKKKEAVLEEKFEKKTKDLVRQKHFLMDEIKSTAREILTQWQTRKIGRKKALKDLTHLKSRAEGVQDKPGSLPEETLPWDKVLPGDRYTYKPWDKPGIVQEKDEKKRQVKIDLGGISLWVDLTSLKSGAPESMVKSAPVSTSGSAGNVPIRLDLRGQYVEEALSELEQYLDQAILAGRKHLEIIHGKGTGALRSAVHEYLKNSVHVAGFSCSSRVSGGEGVTEVELK
ncbi:MAG: Smr/MutS family protein [Desulfonatronovibrio sp.]